MDVRQNEMIVQFLKKRGQQGARALSVLGKQQAFIEALSTKLGQELLGELVDIIDNTLTKMYNEEATPVELANFRVAKTILDKWSLRISDYEKNVQKLIKESVR